MEIFVLLHPEELAALHDTGGNPITQFGTHCVIAHPADSEKHASQGMLFVNGRGFDADVLALLKRRPEVLHVEATLASLTIELRADAAVAPLVSLLVESGAEIEEVYRRDIRLDDLLRTLAEQHTASTHA
jgi:hypothetical protein